MWLYAVVLIFFMIWTVCIWNMLRSVNEKSMNLTVIIIDNYGHSFEFVNYDRKMFENWFRPVYFG